MIRVLINDTRVIKLATSAFLGLHTMSILYRGCCCSDYCYYVLLNLLTMHQHYCQLQDQCHACTHHFSIWPWHITINYYSFLQLTGNHLMPCIFHVLMEIILPLCTWRLDSFNFKMFWCRMYCSKVVTVFKITNQVKGNHQGIYSLATEWDQDKTKCVGATLLIII